MIPIICSPYISETNSACRLEVNFLLKFNFQLLQASYSFYTWPSAPVLAWFLWENRSELPGKKVLELGSGTALPGILAAKCGAQVTLSESATLPKSLAHTKRSCELNSLIVNEHIRVIGVTWGLFLSNLDTLGPIDLILG